MGVAPWTYTFTDNDYPHAFGYRAPWLTNRITDWCDYKKLPATNVRSLKKYWFPDGDTVTYTFVIHTLSPHATAAELHAVTKDDTEAGTENALQRIWRLNTPTFAQLQVDDAGVQTADGCILSGWSASRAKMDVGENIDAQGVPVIEEDNLSAPGVSGLLTIRRTKRTGSTPTQGTGEFGDADKIGFGGKKAMQHGDGLNPQDWRQNEGLLSGQSDEPIVDYDRGSLSNKITEIPRNGTTKDAYKGQKWARPCDRLFCSVADNLSNGAQYPHETAGHRCPNIPQGTIVTMAFDSDSNPIGVTWPCAWTPELTSTGAKDFKSAKGKYTQCWSQARPEPRKAMRPVNQMTGARSLTDLGSRNRDTGDQRCDVTGSLANRVCRIRRLLRCAFPVPFSGSIDFFRFPPGLLAPVAPLCRGGHRAVLQLSMRRQPQRVEARHCGLGQ